MNRRRPRWRRVGLTVVAVSIAIGLTAAAAWAAASAGRPGVATAKKNIAASTAMPKFKVPGPAIDVSSLKGKLVVVIRGNGAVPFVVDVSSAEQAAAKAAGMKTLLIDGHGTASGWSQAIQTAISQHAAGIIGVGLGVDLIRVALQNAKSAHIPVVDVLDEQAGAKVPPGITGNVSINFNGGGRLIADNVIASTNGAPTHVLILGDNEFTSVVEETDGMKAEFKALAPQDKVIFQNTTVSTLATDIPRLVQTELRRDPKISWIAAAYDAQAQYVVPAVAQAGASSKVKVASNNGVAANMKWIQANHIQVFDIAPPTDWGGWAGFDDLARAMLGKPQVNENLKIRSFTPANLKGIDVSSQAALFGTAWQNGYSKLWGLK